MTRLRATYGEGPAHLVGHLAALTAVGVAVWHMLQTPLWLRVVVWLVGAAVLHDLVFAPLLAFGDGAVRRLLPPAARRGPSALNHVRVTIAVSGVLLLVYFPLILDRAPSNYVHAVGRQPADYLLRWALISAGVAVVSALTYLARRRRSGRVEDLHAPARRPGHEDPAGS